MAVAWEGGVLDDMECTLNKREDWIDALKGFAIICVVIGHVLHGFDKSDLFTQKDIAQGIILENVIYSFHMPLFMMISGYVFAIAYSPQKSNNKSRYKIQLLNIALLYFIWSLLYGAIKLIFSKWINSEITLYNIALIPIKAIDLYWYLYVLFLLYLIGRRYILKSWGGKTQLSLVVLTVVLSSVYMIFDIQIEFTAVRVLYYIPFFITGIGIVINKCLKKTYMSVGLGILALIWVVINQFVDITGIVGDWDGWQKPIIGLLISYMFIVLFDYLNINNNVLKYLGVHSLEIYLMHIFITSGGRAVFSKLGMFNYWLDCGILTILGILIPIVVSAVFRSLKIWDFCFKPGMILVGTIRKRC